MDNYFEFIAETCKIKLIDGRSSILCGLPRTGVNHVVDIISRCIGRLR